MRKPSRRSVVSCEDFDDAACDEITLMRTLLARHGETEWNVAGRRQGQLDSPLTTLGRQHATQVASMLDGEEFDMICTSPLGRADETARAIGAWHDKPVTVFDNLAELHHGQFAGLTNAEIEQRYPGALEERSQNKYSWRFPEGESYRDADKRAHTAIREIKEAGSNSPLVVSHAMITRMLVRNLTGSHPSKALEFNLPHGEVLEVRPGTNPQTRWLGR